MSLRLTSTAALAAAVMIASGAPMAALAAPPAKANDGDCFYARDWQGSSAPSDDTILLRVSGRIYRVGVVSGARELNDPGARLVSIARGTTRVCKPIDLDLRIKSSGGAVPMPLIVKSLTKLTPAEAALIPKRDQP